MTLLHSYRWYSHLGKHTYEEKETRSNDVVLWMATWPIWVIQYEASDTSQRWLRVQQSMQIPKCPQYFVNITDVVEVGTRLWQIRAAAAQRTRVPLWLWKVWYSLKCFVLYCCLFGLGGYFRHFIFFWFLDTFNWAVKALEEIN